MECTFEGSSLKSTLLNTKKVDFFYIEVKHALKLQPNSKFWNDAFKLIEKRYLKENKK